MIGQNGLGYKEAGILARGLLTARNLLHLECGNNNFSKKGWKEVRHKFYQFYIGVHES